MNLTIGVVSVVYAAMAGATIWQMYKVNQKNYATLKSITSVLFLVIGYMAYEASGDDFFICSLPAFLFCFLGDVLLAVAHEIDNDLKNPQFVLGVGSFLFAHIFFCWQYLIMLDWHFSGAMVIAIIMVCISIGCTRSDKYDYGSNKIPSIIYSFFVGFLCGLGLLLIFDFLGNGMMMALGIGSALFLTSDFLLSQKYFKRDKPKSLGFFVLVAYYAAMWLLATAVLF